MNHKIDLSNEDHCGPCGQYALEKIEQKQSGDNLLYLSDKDVSDKDVSDKDVSDKDVSDKDVSDKDVLPSPK